MLFAHQGLQAPLAADSQGDTFQLITSGALVSTSIRVLDEDEGWVGEAVLVHLIGGQPGGAALTELL